MAAAGYLHIMHCIPCPPHNSFLLHNFVHIAPWMPKVPWSVLPEPTYACWISSGSLQIYWSYYEMIDSRRSQSATGLGLCVHWHVIGLHCMCCCFMSAEGLLLCQVSCARVLCIWECNGRVWERCHVLPTAPKHWLTASSETLTITPQCRLTGYLQKTGMFLQWMWINWRIILTKQVQMIDDFLFLCYQQCYLCCRLKC